MMVQIEVQPETAALIAQAQAHGVSVDALLRQALRQEEDVTEDTATPQTFEEWDSVLQELINSPSFTKSPLLSDDAFSRDSIYTREDNAL